MLSQHLPIDTSGKPKEYVYSCLEIAVSKQCIGGGERAQEAEAADNNWYVGGAGARRAHTSNLRAGRIFSRGAPLFREGARGRLQPRAARGAR